MSVQENKEIFPIGPGGALGTYRFVYSQDCAALIIRSRSEKFTVKIRHGRFDYSEVIMDPDTEYHSVFLQLPIMIEYKTEVGRV